LSSFSVFKANQSQCILLDKTIASSHFQIYEQKKRKFETRQRVDAYASFLSTCGVYKSTKQQNMMKASQRLRSSALLRLCIVASASIVSVVNAQNPICYLCNGDPVATFLFPDVVITDGTQSATCAQIFTAAISRLFTAEQCAQAQASTNPNIQTLCGCSNIVPAPVALPAPPPVALPVSAPAVLSPVSTPAPILSPTKTNKGMMTEKDKDDKVSKGNGKENKGSKGMGMGEEESKGSGMKRLRYQL
jgi:hypothetical protein